MISINSHLLTSHLIGLIAYVYTYLLPPKGFDWITFSRNMKHDFNINSVKPERVVKRGAVGTWNIGN